MDRMAGQGIRSVSLATTAASVGRTAAPILLALAFWRTGNRDHRPLDAATGTVGAIGPDVLAAACGGLIFCVGR